MGDVVPSFVRVSVEDVHYASSRVFDHMDMSRRQHSIHDDELVDGAARWSGDIADALAHVAANWADKRAALHRSVGEIGGAMSDAALEYAATDQSATDEIVKRSEPF
jgi:hypothetical protein